ncbi:MAG: alpha/beta fold hydrolase [Casimicrobiaceae bacterium]
MITAVTLLLVMLGGTWIWAAWVHGLDLARGEVVVIVAGAIVVFGALIALVTVLWFALAWRYRSPRPPEARLSLAASAQLFRQEYRTLMGSGFRMGFGWWFMREPPPGPADLPVLLIHGVLCNSGVWLGMRGALRPLGLPIYTISYGPPLASIETFADALAQKIDAILRDTGAARVALVGHSMGGIVARAYMRRHGSGKVAILVTVGTPHAGSVLARIFPGTSLEQLRAGNAWLAGLNATPLPAVPIVSIWSWHDSMVAPQLSARLPGAENIAVVGVGHNALLRDPQVIAHVTTALRSAAGANPATTYPAAVPGGADTARADSRAR